MSAKDQIYGKIIIKRGKTKYTGSITTTQNA
jgi:hypothetical protein